MRAHRHAGFTLMEAMVVVALIGITAAIAAPSIQIALADRRANEVSHDLVRLGGQARSEAMVYGRAHLLRYSQASGGTATNNGSVQLWRGRANLCTANNWATIINGSCYTNPNCIGSLDMGSHTHGTSQIRMRISNASNADLCFQPDGEMLVSIAGGPFAAVPPAGTDAVRFTFTRLRNNTPEGVQRAVLFPIAAPARLAR